MRFFPVYSYLVVYRPDTRPLQVIAILHGKRDVGETLRNRLQPEIVDNYSMLFGEDRRYQVFVSSTFRDLEAERAKVL